jgi:AcrR family transcriptional regulator
MQDGLHWRLGLIISVRGQITRNPDTFMPPRSNLQVKYNTPLRQAQRDLTRNRIKNAARNFFYEHHYDATTMDEIALAAGLRRSTLYLHYKDKAEILADVIADYAPKARSLLATLPGPRPTLEQLQRWIANVARFVAKERVPLSIILELRRNKTHTAALENLTAELLAGLGEHNPPFREAARSDADPMLRARGLLLLQELTYACQVFLDDKSDPRSKALLAVTAEDFRAFLR